MYDDEAPWPAEADGTGKTLERISPELPVENAISWLAGCVGGSPGIAFESPCVVTAIPEETIFICTLYPNPTQGKFILSSSESPRSISIIDVNGKLLQIATDPAQNQEIDLTDYPKGIYLVKISLENSTQKMLKVVRY